MKRILISACLLGEAVRYDGRAVPCATPLISTWRERGILLPFCPEMAGGLPVPRPPAEIRGGTGREVIEKGAFVVTRESDVTRAFVLGAEKALAICLAEGIHMALLKEKSPSCGCNLIYDGSFSRTLIKGRGVTAALLASHGIQVFSEDETDTLSTILDLS